MLMDVRPIETDDDYEWSLKQIEPYFDKEPLEGTIESARFNVLLTLIKAYEDKIYPIKNSIPSEIIHFYMDQNSLTQKDLSLS